MFSPLERQWLLEEMGEGPPSRYMEVCGTHTVAIARSGLKKVLPPTVRLISGPGCPVCVTDQQDIDTAIALAHEKGVLLATFGDMARVPGTNGSLAQAKAEGADVRILYSPFEALRLANENPGREAVFLSVGFETTAPLIAAVVKEAARLERRNLSFLILHKLLPPVMKALLGDLPAMAGSDPSLPATRGRPSLDGFLMPGHVCAILGVEPFRFLGERYRLPGVVAGFEADDILLALWMLQRQRRQGRAEMEIAYRRAVREEGNRTAQHLMEEVFQPVEACWRGIGTVPHSGLALRQAYSAYDARIRFPLQVEPAPDPPGCACGEVLRGLLSPPQCPLFGRACTPQSPVGPCMVSSEGSCAASYRYERICR
ncbi:MAG: hydrogenase formation protein HypD [Coprothermobacterota bacterium]|nr:hydrogenase formation protein HypD [Coprothermobacterota bacterium]